MNMEAVAADAGATQTAAMASAACVCANTALSDRVQRRKEKKRRKKELRRLAKDDADASAQTPSQSDAATAPVLNAKPLIVLDLNGILCHRVRRRHLLPRQTSFRPSAGRVANTDVVPRSDLDAFLTLLHDNFRLAIWTSATRKTARALVRMLIPAEVRAKLVFVWHRNFCTLVENSGGEKTMQAMADASNVGDLEGGCSQKENPAVPNACAGRKRKRRGHSSRIDMLCNADDASATDDAENDTPKTAPNKAPSHEDVTAIKCLSKVWSKYRSWDATNTILLDDSPEKCPDMYSKNALHPPPIRGTVTCVGGNSGGGDFIEGKSGEREDSEGNSLSTTDDDEANQTTQRDFFRLLAEHWAEPTSTKDLMAFLDAHADRHNMGWQIRSYPNAEG